MFGFRLLSRVGAIFSNSCCWALNLKSMCYKNKSKNRGVSGVQNQKLNKQMQIQPLQEVQQHDFDEEFYTLKFSIARELE